MLIRTNQISCINSYIVHEINGVSGYENLICNCRIFLSYPKHYSYSYGGQATHCMYVHWGMLVQS